MSVKALARRVLHGYARVLRSLGETLSIAVCLALLAVAIAYPIWWLAVNHRVLYTAIVLGAGGAALVCLAARRALARNNSRRPKHLRGRLARFLAACLLAVGAYGTAVLVSRSTVAGIASGVVLLALLGLWAFGRDRSIDKGR